MTVSRPSGGGEEVAKKKSRVRTSHSGRKYVNSHKLIQSDKVQEQIKQLRNMLAHGR